ncbi:MAG: hypothetical protein J7J03_06990 [Methanosarcinales archaeon]|nr:hypothetical protein [Methanosarcinales archaeon]
MNKRTTTLTPGAILVSPIIACALFTTSHTTFKGRDDFCSKYPAGNPFGKSYGNASGSSMSRVHWTCTGCHSEVGTDVPQRRYWR